MVERVREGWAHTVQVELAGIRAAATAERLHRAVPSSNEAGLKGLTTLEEAQQWLTSILLWPDFI